MSYRPFLFFVCFLPASFSGFAQAITPRSLGLVAPSLYRVTPVKDQYMSSTCWSFSSCSLLESELIRRGKGVQDLSEMFVARYSMIRKINRHLQLKGKNFFTPGGQFHDVIWVMKQYGMVPEEVYAGKGRGERNHDHNEMDTLLSHFVQQCIDAGVTELASGQQHFIDSVLDHYYGTVPEKFIYKGKEYTPVSYLENFLQIDPADFIEITSYTHHPFYAAFVLEDKYNWTGDSYYNVPADVFTAITDNALKLGYTAGWDGDADDEGFDYYNGLAFLPDTSHHIQQDRQAAFENQSTLLNHMMHIVAAVRDARGHKWYYIKNSWGSSTNGQGGYLYMNASYFIMRTVAVIVNKRAIPETIRKKLHIN